MHRRQRQPCQYLRHTPSFPDCLRLAVTRASLKASSPVQPAAARAACFGASIHPNIPAQTATALSAACPPKFLCAFCVSPFRPAGRDHPRSGLRKLSVRERERAKSKQSKLATAKPARPWKASCKGWSPRLGHPSTQHPAISIKDGGETREFLSYPQHHPSALLCWDLAPRPCPDDLEPTFGTPACTPDARD